MDTILFILVMGAYITGIIHGQMVTEREMEGDEF